MNDDIATSAPADLEPELETIASAFDALPQAVLLLAADGRIRWLNAACRKANRAGDLFDASAELVGRPFAAVLQGRAPAFSVPGYTVRSIVQGVRGVLSGARTEYRHPPHRPASATRRWYTLAVKALPNGGAVVTCSDVTDLQEEQAEIEYQARHDALTGLLNRYAFFERAAPRAARARREGRPLHVLLLDLDGFKPVNDRFGHHAGDYALAQLGRRLRDAVRRSDLVARLGGDEFLVLAETDAPEEVERRLRAAVAEPLRVDGEDVELGVSIGRACLDEGAGIDEIVRLADDRMYDEKFAGASRDGPPPERTRARRARADAAPDERSGHPPGLRGDPLSA